jgi:hypothetical protein
MPEDSSVAKHPTTRHEKLGKQYIAHFLPEYVQLHKLCSRLLDQIDKKHFIDIGRRMLKSLYLGLVRCAKTELEKQGARLLKSSSGRTRICEYTADLIKSEDNEDNGGKRRVAEQLQLTEQRLEMFTKDISIPVLTQIHCRNMMASFWITVRSQNSTAKVMSCRIWVR